MSRTRFSHAQNSTINGPRPSPLRINKDSIPIRKPSSVFAVSSMISDQQEKIRPQKNNPVIIYTLSPKIIHTQARDFMALVQKLTGLSKSEPHPIPERGNDDTKDEEVAIIGGNGHKGSSSSPPPSSTLTKENCWGGENSTDHQHNQMSRVFSDSTNVSHPYLADFPLFTPTSANLFSSPNSVGRFPSSLHVSPGMGNPISPSFFEFIKGLPEY